MKIEEKKIVRFFARFPQQSPFLVVYILKLPHPPATNHWSPVAFRFCQ